MYETRLLPHENDQITVSILLKNQSSCVIKELVFSMCDTPAVSLLRAVCNGFDVITCTIVWHHVFQVNHKLHRLRAPFMPFMLHLCKVCLVENVMCKFGQFTVIRIYGTQYARELICLVTSGISWPLRVHILTQTHYAIPCFLNMDVEFMVVYPNVLKFCRQFCPGGYAADY